MVCVLLKKPLITKQTQEIKLNLRSQKILILDFGSQYTQLIARRIRELGAYCEIHSFDADEAFIRDFNPQGIILSGGPNSVHAEKTPRAHECVFELACPVLGICYGMQTMAQQLGGKVKVADKHEYGYAKVALKNHSQLLDAIEDDVEASGDALLDVWMSHGDSVVSVPQGFDIIAKTKDTPVAAMANNEKQFYGIQFHPEVTHTKQGARIIKRFIQTICGIESQWTSANIVAEQVQLIKDKVGGEKVILGLSGGVDSSVAAALLHKAIGDNLECVFVDNGLLRLNEVDQVQQIFAKNMKINLHVVDAKARFLNALKGHVDPEKKRKIIGNEFIEVFQEQAKRLGDVKWLAQGTIYPDVIESAAAKTGAAQVIKSHHNVGGLPETMHLKLVEPLRDLFKDEVRRLGVELGLPYDMVYRHPFPGPGLGVRVLGEVKSEYLPLLQQADHLFIEALRAADLYDKVSQAFVVFLPVRSVGVKGDARSYDYVVALRAVETVDFMTARWAHLPYDFIEDISSRIMNEIDGISRVVYDVSSKPPSTIEWE